MVVEGLGFKSTLVTEVSNRGVTGGCPCTKPTQGLHGGKGKGTETDYIWRMVDIYPPRKCVDSL